MSLRNVNLRRLGARVPVLNRTAGVQDEVVLSVGLFDEGITPEP